ncbi:hypothetical protein MMAD_48730 [Mycolicibacterium madagascariense]|uniref:Uncharacterized protein n=1 Tax=Mycolicibacterium madagascariense TaxID=212765 RepID=A0A7I7XMW5_9MYCO|nr:hypothetical protein MMAD_48730 [Mycolicibacterium madagascariense]
MARRRGTGPLDMLHDASRWVAILGGDGPDARSGSDDVASDPDPASTELAPVDGVDPPDDTTPSSLFGSGPPGPDSPGRRVGGTASGDPPGCPLSHRPRR